MQQFEKRLSALERARSSAEGPSVPYVVLFNGADAFDAAMVAGDHDTAVAVLAAENPTVPEWELREYFLFGPAQDISESPA